MPANRTQRDAEDRDDCLIQAGADVATLVAFHVVALTAPAPMVAQGGTHAPGAATVGLGSRGPPAAGVA